MALVAFFTFASALAKYMPLIVKAVTGIVKLVQDIKNDLNPDTVIRVDVQSRIAHVNVVIGAIASAAGRSITIPSVAIPSDYPNWQRFVTEFMNEFIENQMVPLCAVPTAQLLLLYPPPRPRGAITLSDVAGLNLVQIQNSIAAETNPATQAKAITAYNAVAGFLNTYQNVFTLWQGQLDLQSAGVLPLDDKDDLMVSRSYFARETYQTMFASAWAAFFRANPTQMISKTGSLFIPSPDEWTQSSTDDFFINTNMTENNDIGTDNLTAVAANTSICWRRYTGYGLLPAPVAGDITTYGQCYQYDTEVPGNTRQTNNSPTALPFSTDNGPILQTMKNLANAGTLLTTTAPTCSFNLQSYNTVPNSTGQHATQLPMTYAQIPKTGNYDWYGRINVRCTPPNDSKQVFVRLFAARPSLTSVSSTAVNPMDVFDLGVLMMSPGPGNTRFTYEKVIDLEFNSGATISPYMLTQLPIIYVWAVVTLLPYNSGLASQNWGVVAAGGSGVPALNILNVWIEPLQVIAVMRPDPVYATTLTYRTWNNQNQQNITSGTVTFFQFMGSILRLTGDDPNLDLAAVWRRRLGDSGVDLNYIARWIIDVATALGVDVTAKYTAIGIDMLSLANSQDWIYQYGPFWNKETNSPFPTEVVNQTLNYLYSDLHTAAAYLTQTPQGAQALGDTRGY